MGRRYVGGDMTVVLDELFRHWAATCDVAGEMPHHVRLAVAEIQRLGSEGRRHSEQAPHALLGARYKREHETTEDEEPE
jgi:hypothetical protein